MPMKSEFIADRELKTLQLAVNARLRKLEEEICYSEDVQVLWGPVTKKDGYTVLLYYQAD